jgi:phospholipid/cholesterol/gamma-HCH transport system substrate-binding protein
METRAHHLVIGSFAVGITLALVMFLLWIGKVELNREYQTYDLVFQGSVAGLSVAGDVLYNGIKVGEITDIDLDPDNPDHVLVRIRVRKDTPVKNDSVASMDSQGLTGVANVLISGGTEKAGPLTAAEGQTYPMIPTKKSTFQELFAGTPELINRGNKLLERASQFLSDENQKVFADTLIDIHRLTKNLANASDRLDSITASVDELAKNTNTLIKGDAKATFADIRGVAGDIRQVMADARGPLRDFARAGLPELLLLISDARQMIGTIDRAAQRFESSPSSILFGDKASEYNPGGK